VSAAKPSYKFVADTVGLDFLNALVHPGNAIADGEGFVRWIEQAGLVPTDALQSLLAKAVPGEMDAVAAQARALGEWFRGFVQDHKGNRLPAEAIDHLQPLNQILERDIRVGKVDARDTINDRIAGSGLKWTSERAYSVARHAAAADRPGDRRTDLRRAIRQRTALRVTRLQAPIPGSEPRPGATVVQHGGLRQSGKAGDPSQRAGPVMPVRNVENLDEPRLW
jgi:Putative stress-induced transcription regulator